MLLYKPNAVVGIRSWSHFFYQCCQQTFDNKIIVDITQQCFALLPQVNFPTNNLNCH